MANDSTKNVAHANESFRFVQLSDPHLSSPGLPNPLRLTNKRILGYLSWLRRRRRTYKRWVLDLAVRQIQQQQISHFVVTGDLTHIGLASEFEQVVQWLTSLGKPQDVTVIPGNHDLYVNERWDRSFAKWHAYMNGDQRPAELLNDNVDAQQNLEQIFPSIRLRSNCAFISMSSVFAAPWFRATGRVNQTQLDRLTQILQQPQLKNLCKILLIHHPISTQSIAQRKRLINYPQLIEILRDNPVQLVLHGHGHRTGIETLSCKQGINTPVVGAASSSSVDQRNSYKAEYLLFDVTRTTESWCIHMRNFNLHLAQKKFIETNSTTFFVAANL